MKKIRSSLKIMKICELADDCLGNFNNSEFPLATQLSSDRCTLKLQYLNLSQSSHAKEYILVLHNPCLEVKAILSPKGSFILLIL